MSKARKLLLGFITATVIMQFIRPSRNITVVQTDNSMEQLYNMPAAVKSIFNASCFDCHSNNTQYPWYANIQPVGWWLSDHIKDGKAELNFDAFGDYSRRRRISKLKAIVNSVNDGSMPLPSYTWIHQAASLTQAQKSVLNSWLTKVTDSLSSH